MDSQPTNPLSATSTDSRLQGEQANLVSLISISIPHDLAVQIVGSDAGKEKRMRPHGSMTKNAPTAEVQAVVEFMQPFLDREIDRVHNRNTRGIRGYAGAATEAQALGLKRFCERFATSLRLHLDKRPGDDNLHRTRQRLNQAYDVIRQINAGLGLADEEVRPVESILTDFVIRLQPVRDELLKLNVNGRRSSNWENIPSSQVAVVAALLEPIDQFLASRSPVAER